MADPKTGEVIETTAAPTSAATEHKVTETTRTVTGTPNEGQILNRTLADAVSTADAIPPARGTSRSKRDLYGVMGAVHDRRREARQRSLGRVDTHLRGFSQVQRRRT